MQARDLSRPVRQVTRTVDYTEVLEYLDTHQFAVVWHDNVLSEHSTEYAARVCYNLLITREGNRGQ